MDRELKVVFLDFDGVLNNPGCYAIASGERTPAHQPSVAALNRITDTTGAVIVISSTWRYSGIMFCKEKLREWGVTGKVFDRTPPIHANQRGYEIGQWLMEQDDVGRYDVKSFVILDDDSDMGSHKNRLVQTNGAFGLTESDADRAIEMLSA